VPDIAPVDRVQDGAEADTAQHDERQRDVNGVLGLMSGGEAPERERRHPPTGEQNERIALVAAIADDSGDGEDDGDRLVDEQRHQEERRRLTATFGQEPPPCAKRVANPGHTGRVGEEAGKAEDDGCHGGEQKRGQLAAQRAESAPDRPVRHGQRGDRDTHDHAHYDGDRARSSGVGGPGNNTEGDCRAAGAAHETGFAEPNQAGNRRQRQRGDDDLGRHHTRGVDQRR
jgi:hypothetical protein